MSEARPFNFTGRLRSFRYALRGIGAMIQSQHNAWIHAVCSVLVVASAIWFRVSAGEWCWLIVAITGVWTAEALNTAFEFLCDVASPDFHPAVEKSKDVAAGAVLLSAMGATAIGIVIFLPRVYELM
jgi:diacylglycerol kinase (ATP)